MDNSPTTGKQSYREDRFREPSLFERKLGLWVDRVGKSTSSNRPERFRILGQYCHICVLKGSGFYVSETAGKLAVEEGCCMVQFPEEPCLYYPNGVWTTCWVAWNGPESRVFEELGFVNPRYPVFPDTGRWLWEAYSTLLPILHDESSEAALRRKLIALDMIRKEYRESQRAQGALNHPPAAREIAVWLQQHYRHPVNITDLARRFNLSPSHLRRVFKAYTGQSPTSYLRSLRITASKRLLLQGVPIKQIACQVGYHDVFYFMRLFKNTVGVSAGSFSRNSGL